MSLLNRETCWLTLSQVIELLRSGQLKIQSEDRSEITLNMVFIDRTKARTLADDNT